MKFSATLSISLILCVGVSLTAIASTDQLSNHSFPENVNLKDPVSSDLYSNNLKPENHPLSVPTITVTGSFTGFSTCSGIASTAQIFTVSGTNLTAGITLTTTSGFEISLNDNLFSNSITLSETGGSISSTILYARLSASATSPASGSISFTSSGAVTQVLNYIGTVYPLPVTPTISYSGSTVLCSGSTLDLISSSTSGNQWYLNGVAISGANNIVYPATAAGNYTVSVTNGNGCTSTSAQTTLTQNASSTIPVITAQGVTTFCAGGFVDLTSSASSGNQWFFNGTAISNATGVTYRATASGSYTVQTTATGGCSNSTSPAIIVTVNAVPATASISAGSPTTFCAGGSVLLSSNTATGNQWYNNGTAISGATGSTYTATATGSYTDIISNAGDCFSQASNAIVVTVNAQSAAATITANGPTTFCSGGSVTLTSSAASGNQWYLNGTAISGAMGITYTATSSGNYTVETTGTGSCTSAISNTIAVTVNSASAIPTIIANGPLTFCSGNSVLLTSSLSANNQWYLNGNAISNATNSTFTATTAGNYTVEATSGCNTMASAAVTVTINALPAAPVIAAGGSVNICSGDSVVLTSSSPTGNQWYDNGMIIGSATNNSLTVSAAGSYTVTTTNGNSCTSVASAATVVLINTSQTAPAITAGGITTFCSGGFVDLTSSVTSGNQWYLNGTAISGATGVTYTATVAGSYTVRASGGSGCTVSTSAALVVTVNPIPATPIITSGSSASFCTGGSVILSSNAISGNQWYFNGNPISNATSTTYTATIAGSYTLQTTNAGNCTSDTSAAMVVSIYPIPAAPTISTGGGNLNICAGNTLLLTSSNSTGNQWYDNGIAISGANGITYEATLTGNYSVTTTNSNGCTSIQSNAVQVNVIPIPATAQITAGSATTICSGNSVTLTSSVNTGNQWYENGIAISGATSNTYLASEAGIYTVQATNGQICSGGISDPITVTVNPSPPTPTVSISGSTSFCAGSSVILVSNSVSGNQWYNNGVAIPNANGIVYTASSSGNYTVESSNGFNCSSSPSVAVVVTSNTIPPTPVITAGSAVTFCTGGSVQLNSSALSGNQWFNNGVAISGATGTSFTASTGGNYTVQTTGTGNCSSSISAAIQVTADTLPTVPSITANGLTTFCSGGSVMLNSNLVNNIQWYNNGIAINNAIGNSYTVTASGNYTATSTNSYGCNSQPSQVISVTVNTTPSLPVITAGSATSFCLGGSVALNSSATSGNQWFLNGTAITGATGITYNATTSGYYTVQATNAGSCSSLVSASTLVTVDTLPSVPAISAGSLTTFCSGSSVILSSNSVSGNQWYVNGNAISGATGSTYTASASGIYTVVATNSFGCISQKSQNITVTVNTAPVMPTITAGSATTFCSGDSVILTSSATTGNQWFLNGVAINAATGASYKAFSGGYYEVQTTNSNNCSSPISTATEIIVNTIPAIPSVIAGGATSFCSGGSVILTSSGSSGNQWFKNDTAISNATGNTYTVTTSGNYTVVASNGSGCSSQASLPITVNVYSIPAMPTISASSATTFCMGSSVVLTSSATNGNQWYLNGTPIAGATGKSYTASSGGFYEVLVTNSGNCSGTISAAILVTVNSIPAVPTIAAGGLTTFCSGDSVILSSNALTGIQWYNNGIAISNATGNTYTATSSGTYTAEATNGSGCNSTSSSGIIVTVHQTPATPIIEAASDTTFCSGGSVLLFSNALTGNQWFYNGAAISAANGTTYTASTSGYYSVQATGTGNCTSSISTGVRVSAYTTPATPVIQARGLTTFCSGNFVNLISSVDSGNQWYQNGIPIKTATDTFYKATASGIYTVVATNGGICSSNSSLPITVVVNPVPATPSITAAGNTSFCSGDSLLLTSSSLSGNQWYRNDSIIPGATSINYTTTTSGNYQVQSSNLGTCSSLLSAATTVIVNTIPSLPIITAGGVTTFCSGGFVNLMSSDSTGNQWYKNGIAISAATDTIYRATSSGVYTVQSTGTGSCISAMSAGTTVIVDSIPAAPAVSAGGLTSFCLGDSVVLSSNAVANNQWYNSGVAITGATGTTYTASSAGIYSVSYTTGTGCLSSISPTIKVTVNALPVTASISYSGSATICSGDSIVLKSSIDSSNQWYNNGIAISNATDSLLTVYKSGSYTVITTNSFHCSSPASKATIVTVNALPAKPVISFTGSTSICTGDSITLNSSALKGNQWYRNGIALNGDTSAQFVTGTKGTYFVKVTNSQTGCFDTSAVTGISLKALPAAPVISRVGNQLFAGSGYSSYQWLLDKTDITGAIQDTLTPVKAGIYAVQITDSTGCSNVSSDSLIKPFMFVNSSASYPVIHSFKVYPNPASYVVNIVFDHVISSTVSVQLISSLGQIITQTTTSSQNISLPLGNIISGLYYLNIIGIGYNETIPLRVVK